MYMPLLAVPVPRCPQWTLSSFVFGVVCCVVISDAFHCVCAVDLWLSVL
jgi:hypothetical protein